MKKLTSILASFALAFGLMVPAVAFADDGYASVAIDYNGQRINLKPQISNDANSLMVSFDVQADDARYQSYIQTSFTLSSEARDARIAQSDASGSTVVAVVSNGEDPLAFNDGVFYLGQLSVNVAAKLGAGDGTGAKIVVSSMDVTDSSFSAPAMYTMDTRNDEGTMTDAASRSVPFSIATSAYTGTEAPGVVNPPDQKPPAAFEKDPSAVGIGLGQMGTGTSISEGAKSTLQTIGADILQKVKDDLANMLAGKGTAVGLTSEQLQKIAQVVEAAGGDLSKVDISLTPMATKLGSESAAGAISELNKKFSGATLLSIYDLGVNLVASCGTVSTGDIAMSELASPIEFTVGVPEGSLATMNAAVGFMHAGAVDTISKGVVPDAQANAVSFPASKFSPYAVYGKMKSATPNGNNYGSLVNSGDAKPFIMLGFAGLVLVASIIVVFTGRKKAEGSAK